MGTQLKHFDDIEKRNGKIISDSLYFCDDKRMFARSLMGEGQRVNWPHFIDLTRIWTRVSQLIIIQN